MTCCFWTLPCPGTSIPEAAQLLPHVTLYNIDQFSVPPSQELERQVRQAEELLCQEQARFEAWEACRDLIPRVDALGTYLAGEVDFRIRDVVKELHLSQEQDRIFTGRWSPPLGRY